MLAAARRCCSERATGSTTIIHNIPRCTYTRRSARHLHYHHRRRNHLLIRTAAIYAAIILKRSTLAAAGTAAAAAAAAAALPPAYTIAAADATAHGQYYIRHIRICMYNNVYIDICTYVIRAAQ